MFIEEYRRKKKLEDEEVMLGVEQKKIKRKHEHCCHIPPKVVESYLTTF
jgi:hypothetical protein